VPEICNVPLQFSKSADSEQEITLDSILISAVWLCGRAVAGRSAPLEVQTAFVGQGAPIRIEARNSRGDRLGRTEGVVRNNRFRVFMPIPEEARIGDKAHFTVELPNNSIDGESNKIPIYPPVEVFNLIWSKQEARRGDILTLKADVNGLRDQDEVEVIIYEYDSDGAHDEIVRLPARVSDKKIQLRWEYEYHEDTDGILTQEEADQYGGRYNPPEYFFTVRVEGTEYGAEQESGLLTFKDFIEIELVDADGRPRANENYMIHFADGSTREGTLDSRGRARVDDVPPGRYRVEFPDTRGVGRQEERS
jgi:hypothetical protein